MADAEPTGPASERADATRERIVQAARELVVEHGYDGVSTAQVLDRFFAGRRGGQLFRAGFDRDSGRRFYGG